MPPISSQRIAFTLAALLSTLGFAGTADGATFFVAPPPTGNNANPGSSGAPWATLQHAADTIGPGDTVIVRAGQYAAFEIGIEASQALPVVFRAAPGELVELVTDLPVRLVGVNIENSSWITIEGFRANNRGIAGFRAALSENITFRGNVAQNNGTWGIFTGCCDDVVIEGNLTSGSCEEHGIYVSNSGDRPIIRGNVIFDNNANGIHMNGDLSSDCDTDTDGDGVISQAIVEGNFIFDNGHGECTPPGGGSGVNGDGLQNSVIRNNVIWDAHHSGISLYQIDGGAPAHNNRVLGNTVHAASNGRWAVNIMNGSQGTVLRDNILYSDHSFRGAISACATCLTGLSSDRNATENTFSVDGGGTAITLAQWRTATNQDLNSFAATPASLVVSAATGDYRLPAGSLALNAGVAHAELTRDHEGQSRPQAGVFDIGAFEGAGGLFRDGFEGGSPVRWTDAEGAGPW